MTYHGILHTHVHASCSSFCRMTLKKFSTPLFNIGSQHDLLAEFKERREITFTFTCSCLNHDLHKLALLETPLCQYGAVETSSHFLLPCHLYHGRRDALLSNLRYPPTAKDLTPRIKTHRYGMRTKNPSNIWAPGQKADDWIHSLRKFYFTWDKNMQDI